MLTSQLLKDAVGRERDGIGAVTSGTNFLYIARTQHSEKSTG